MLENEEKIWKISCKGKWKECVCVGGNVKPFPWALLEGKGLPR